MNSLIASAKGLELVDQKRRHKRWNKTAPMWCREAFTTRSTLNRFWAGKPVRQDTFMAICRAVGADWEEVSALPMLPKVTASSGFVLPKKIAPIRHWFGRTKELDDLKMLLLQSSTRTVTITAVSVVGFAGIGKTTLASVLVRQLQAIASPFVAAAWESLGSATGKPPRFDSIIDSLLHTLSLGCITTADIILEDYFQKTERLVQLLKAQPSLVVLDNVETVLTPKHASRAGYFADECSEYAWLFKRLAETDHQSKIIFTSRETLAELPRLQTRSFGLGGLDETASVTLLRSLGLIGTTEDLTELAQRYEGHPKALELVAAVIDEDFQGQVSQFLADRKWLLIRDLESLIDEVVNRLSAEEYTCLSQISVYQTPRFPLLTSGIAAQMPAVSERDLKENIILALKRRQLLDYDGDRQSYQMHPLVQEKASYLLNRETKCTAHRQAYRYFLQQAKSQAEWQELADIQPLLLAHYHACQVQDWDEAARAIADIFLPLRHWSHFELIVDLYGQLLPLNWKDGSMLVSSAAVHSDILCRMGITYEALGQRQLAQEYLQQSLYFAQQVGDRKREVNALSYLGLNAETMGQFEIAIQYLEKANSLVREVDDCKLQYRTLSQLGIACCSLGRYHAAIALFQQSLIVSRQHNYQAGEGAALGNLGDAYTKVDQLELALECSQKCLAIAQQVNNPKSQNFARAILAQAYNSVAGSNGQTDYFERAIELSQECLQVAREMKHTPTESWALRNLGIAYRALKEYQKSINCLTKAREIAHQTNEQHKAGEALYQLGITYGVAGELELSTVHLQQSLLIFQSLGSRANAAMALLALAKSAASDEMRCDYLDQAECIAEELQLPVLKEIRQLRVNGGNQLTVGNGSVPDAIACSNAVELEKSLLA